MYTNLSLSATCPAQACGLAQITLPGPGTVEQQVKPIVWQPSAKELLWSQQTIKPGGTAGQSKWHQWDHKAQFQPLQ
jgi:hypothetical protein